MSFFRRLFGGGDPTDDLDNDDYRALRESHEEHLRRGGSIRWRDWVAFNEEHDNDDDAPDLDGDYLAGLEYDDDDDDDDDGGWW